MGRKIRFPVPQEKWSHKISEFNDFFLELGVVPKQKKKKGHHFFQSSNISEFSYFYPELQVVSKQIK